MPTKTPKVPTRAERLAAFGDALGAAMSAAGVTQVELAADLKTTQSAVSAWVTGKSEPDDPYAVFAVERAVKVRPGSLSRFLGYLPPEAVKVSASLEEAIDGDPYLDADARELLLNTYRTLSKSRRGRGQRR